MTFIYYLLINSISNWNATRFKIVCLIFFHVNVINLKMQNEHENCVIFFNLTYFSRWINENVLQIEWIFVNFNSTEVISLIFGQSNNFGQYFSKNYSNNIILPKSKLINSTTFIYRNKSFLYAKFRLIHSFLSGDKRAWNYIIILVW